MKKNMKERGITIISLVVTITILLILSGIGIATLTKENGILKQANTAKSATNKETVREKVEPAVLDSYGTDGNIDATLLNNKLKERGIDAKITSFPATIEVDGYNITIQEDGTVTIEE